MVGMLTRSGHLLRRRLIALATYHGGLTSITKRRFETLKRDSGSKFEGVLGTDVLDFSEDDPDAVQSDRRN